MGLGAKLTFEGRREGPQRNFVSLDKIPLSGSGWADQGVVPQRPAYKQPPSEASLTQVTREPRWGLPGASAADVDRSTDPGKGAAHRQTHGEPSTDRHTTGLTQRHGGMKGATLPSILSPYLGEPPAWGFGAVAHGC